MLNSRAGIVVTAIISMAGLSLSQSMQLHGAMSPARGGGVLCKTAIYIKFCEKHVLYVNPRIFTLLSPSEFAYIGPKNLNLYGANN